MSSPTSSPELHVSIGTPLLTPEDYAEVWSAQLQEIAFEDYNGLPMQGAVCALQDDIRAWPTFFREASHGAHNTRVEGQRREITVYEDGAQSALLTTKDGRLATAYRGDYLVSTEQITDPTSFSDAVQTASAQYGAPPANVRTQQQRMFVTPVLHEGHAELTKTALAMARQQLHAFTTDRVERFYARRPQVDAFLGKATMERNTELIDSHITAVREACARPHATQEFAISSLRYYLTSVSVDDVAFHTFSRQAGSPGFGDHDTVCEYIRAVLDGPEGFHDARQALIASTAGRICSLLGSSR